MPNRVQRTCDKTVVVLMVLLLLMGLVTLFSATYYQKAATGDALAAVTAALPEDTQNDIYRVILKSFCPSCR